MPVSGWLRETLDRLLPLGLRIGTEKARSEFIIAPVLAEVRQQCGGRVSLFSGVDFTVDQEQGLRGACDFLFSLSPEHLSVEAPVVAVVEAKNGYIPSGVAQCMAEMVAAQRFNAQQGNDIASVFGVVTTGTNWQFMRLTGDAVLVDPAEYFLSELERIVGVLVWMLRGGPD